MRASTKAPFNGGDYWVICYTRNGIERVWKDLTPEHGDGDAHLFKSKVKAVRVAKGLPAYFTNLVVRRVTMVVGDDSVVMPVKRI